MSDERRRDELDELHPADQMEQRLLKREALLAQGDNPYGARIDHLVSTDQARERFAAASEGEEIVVRLAGRLTAMRVMGKSIFADLKDRAGRLQLYMQKNTLGEEAFNHFKKLDLGDLVAVEGVLFTTRMGETTLKASSCELLAKALRPLPEKWHGLTDVEHRYRQRYVDLIVNDEVREVFRKRVAIIREIRGFLDARGFMEVETPMLQPIPGGAAARPFETFYNALDCAMYLRIAPELYLKRLLVGGFEKVYEINRNFRNEGLSRRHNPEFTMVEIYAAYSDCRGMMELVEEMVRTAAEKACGKLTFCLPGTDETIDLAGPWLRVAYADLVKQRMGEDWYGLTRAERAERATAEGLHVDASWNDLEITHEVYEKLVEKTLVQPTFVTRLPAELVPLAKRCSDDPTVVDVFELEIGGQEIAPGYSELNDPVEQRKRFEEQARRTAGTAEEQSGRIDEDFLVAMEHGMPPAGGMGLGIDRLVALLAEQASIRDVILFPQMRPK